MQAKFFTASLAQTLNVDYANIAPLIKTVVVQGRILRLIGFSHDYN